MRWPSPRPSPAPRAESLAPTGKLRPREPAPGQEGLWEPLPQKPSRAGEVDDDNAFVMDGVAPHAGLFGTAPDVARFGQAILEELAGASKIAAVQRQYAQHDAACGHGKQGSLGNSAFIARKIVREWASTSATARTRSS